MPDALTLSEFHMLTRKRSFVAILAAAFLLLVAAASVRAQAPVPILNGVQMLPSGELEAWFGYDNPGPQVDIPIGENNFVTPGNPSHGQPTTFLSGRHDDVFRLRFNTQVVQQLTWFLGETSVSASAASPSAAVAFTYQGILTRNGVPLNGASDVAFRLFRSQTGGTQIGATAYRAGIAIDHGIFSTEIAFDGLALMEQQPVGEYGPIDLSLPRSPFDGSPGYWVELAVRQTPGVGEYVTLAPRQPISPAPWALVASRSVMAEYARGIVSGKHNYPLLTSDVYSTVFLGQNQNVKILANGQFVVNASSGATGAVMTADPQGSGYIHVGNPNLGSGGFTSLRMGITAASGGEAEISAIKASGSEYGNLVLNRSGGRVAIGNIAVPNFQLQLSQNSAAKPGGGAWADSSDSRLKYDVQPLQGSLDRLLRLRGVTYQWINPEEHGNLTGPQVGMIAQEVQQVFPEWIGTDQRGFLTLGIRGFEALAVESLRELNARTSRENLTLQAKVSQLEQDNAGLRTRLERIEAILASDAKPSLIPSRSR